MPGNNASSTAASMTSMRSAAVLVPIYRDAEARVRIILVRRANHGAHAGQIALPGGKPEPGDRDLLATAIREAAEETGMAPRTVQPISALPTVVTQTSRFRIHPFLAWITPPRSWRCEAREIAGILDLAATDLGAPGTQTRADIHLVDGRIAVDMPCLTLHPAPIWGATYRILAPLLPALSAADVRWFPPPRDQGHGALGGCRKE